MVCAILVTSVAVGLATVHRLRDAQALELGAALFTGQRDLHGTIFGHDVALPAEASRCANCHEIAPRRAPVPDAGASVEIVAPALGRGALLGTHRRRNGPPSSFTRDGFCRLLRTGIDPADVLVSRTMPRYPLSDLECDALWRYLTSRSSN